MAKTETSHEWNRRIGKFLGERDWGALEGAELITQALRSPGEALHYAGDKLDTETLEACALMAPDEALLYCKDYLSDSCATECLAKIDPLMRLWVEA